MLQSLVFLITEYSLYHFIQGKSYSSFYEMKLDELEACEESLQELHKSKVLHGDLNPGNFIIVHEQTKCKAFIIDFGRSKLVKDNEDNLLKKEMEKFIELVKVFKSYYIASNDSSFFIPTIASTKQKFEI